MPPKKKPVQAGKFKPLKRPTNKAQAAAEPNPSPSAAAINVADDNGGNSASATDNQHSRSRSPKGRGGGRGGRGGKFVAPTGQTFFTGNAIAGGGSSARSGTRASARGASADTAPLTQKYTLSRNAAESAAAAARAREGEGEEIVLMEMDLEEEDGDVGGSVGKSNKKMNVVERDRPAREGPSLFDELEKFREQTYADLDAYEYDSDSSIDEENQRRQHKNGNSNFRLAPYRLPFPVASHQQSMYDCQDATTTSLIKDEKKSSDVEMPSQKSSTKLRDPVLQSPFINANSVSDDLKQLELNSWFLMKFPTRLPRIDVSGSGSKRSTNIKKEMSEDDGPDFIGSSVDPNDVVLMSTTYAGTSASGYDNTLKDLTPGKYGRIIVRKSGRTELIIGGGNPGEPEVRMLIHEGLQCGFRQEVVSIDPEVATFVPLGNVNKSIVVTPDIEAFALT